MGRSRWDEVDELRRRAADYLLGFPGVHAVGARRKVVRGITEDRPAISVYVSWKRPKHLLQAGIAIPREIFGCPTDVFQQPPPRLTNGTAQLDVRREVLEGGFAIESNEGPGVATLGCIAQVTSSGSTFPVALTCNHVLETDRLSGITPGTIVGHPGLSSWCANYWSTSNIIGTCFWGANTGQRSHQVNVPGVDAGAVRLKVGQKYKETIFDALQTGSTLNGSHDPTPTEIANGFNVHVVGMASFPKRGTSHGVIADVCTTAILLSDQHRYYYRDCYLIRTGSSDQIFSEDSDSGAAVFDNQRRVVGILFSGSINELQEIQLAAPDGSPYVSGCWDVSGPKAVVDQDSVRGVPGSWVCKISNVIQKFNADNAGMTLSIPVGTGDEKVVTGPAEPARPTLLPAQEEALRRARERLYQTELGREISGLLRAHRREVRELIRTNRHVAVSWHRVGGPTLPFALLDAALNPSRPLPEKLGRLPLKQGMQAFGQHLIRFGTENLARDVEAFGPVIEGATTGSLDDFLEALSERSRNHSIAHLR